MTLYKIIQLNNHNIQMTKQKSQNLELNQKLNSTYSQTSQKQTNAKQIFNSVLDLLQSLFFYFYCIMSFFQQTINDPELKVTATIGIIQNIPYSILETLVMIVIFAFAFRNKAHSKYLKILMLICFILVLIFNIRYWVSKEYLRIGLIIRPIYIILYSQYVFKITMKYFKILTKCLKYFVLMWFFLLIFASIGIKLYSQITFANSFNVFQNLWQAIYSMFVMQTTDNYPDVGLPYFGLNKANIIFFVVVVVVNTMLISNIIIATNYNTYKTITQQQYFGQSLIELLYLISSENGYKQDEEEFLKLLNQRQKYYIDVIESIYFSTLFWIFKIALFFLICFDTKSGTVKAQAVLLFIINFILFIIRFSIFYIRKFKFINLHLFQLYQILSSIVGIIIFIVAASGAVSYQTYTKLIILLLPSIVKFPIGFIFQSSESLFRFLQRFKQISQMLFLVSLLFAGIAQIWFGGIMTDDKANLLANPDYIYLNFNNTLNSFITLFALVIVDNWDFIATAYQILLDHQNTRYFFVLYYTFGVQIAYNLVLASIIQHIVQQAQRFKSIQTYKDKGSYKQFLSLKQQVWSIKENLIKQLRNLYKQKEGNEVYPNDIPQKPSLSCPQQIIQAKMYRGLNIYSLIYYCSNNQELTFQSATRISNQNIKTGGIDMIYTVIESDLQNKQLWKVFNIRQIFEKQGIQLQNKQIFEDNVRAKLQNLNIYQKQQDFNNVQILAEYYLGKQINEDDEVPYFINFDLPPNYTFNVKNLYIKRQKLAKSFRYRYNSMMFLIQKIKINKISKNLAKKIKSKKLSLQKNSPEKIKKQN